MEAEAPRVARVVRVKRTRPVVAEAASTVEKALAEVASGRKEDTITIVRYKQSAIYAIPRCPNGFRILHQFFPLFFGRHLPANKPFVRDCLTFIPRKIIAIIFRFVGTHITGSPKGAAWLTKVN